MSEGAAASAASSGGNSGTTPPAAPTTEFAPITSQDDLNKIIAARVDRERAKFADYADLKTKAGELDLIKEANKTEAQRLSEQADAARSEAESAKAELLRYRVAAQHGITEQDDIDLFLTGKDEDTLTKQAKRLLERGVDASKPRSPRPDPNQGRGGSAVPGEPRDQFGSWLNATQPH